MVVQPTFAARDLGGGDFLSAGGAAASRIARWDGSSWAPLGSGTAGRVNSLVSYDSGGGPALHAGGGFFHAGGVLVNFIARWTGSSWSALAGGTNLTVHSLLAVDDGNGPALFAGGEFSTAGGVAALRVARWSGSTWSALGSGMNGTVQALEWSGADAVLFAGGAFEVTYDSGDSYLSRWACPQPDTAPPVLCCPESVIERVPFATPPGEIVTFTVTATDDQDPSPDIVCVPPSGSFFPPGTTMVLCTATDVAGNESTCQFPIEVRIKVRRR